MAVSKLNRRASIKKRIRSKISGSADCPRLTVFRSNKQIYAQLVDDVNAVTIAGASSRDKDIAASKKITKIEQAGLVGKSIAEKAKKKGIDSIVF